MKPSFDLALESALSNGARLIQLREKDLPPREVLSLALRAQQICERFGAKLLVNSRADIARAAHADGVHLPESALPPAAARLSLNYHALCGVSVHSLEGVHRAVEEGADYLVLGPVFSTASHPDTVPVGLALLRQAVAATSCPIFAIGGISPRSARACREAGAYGVAVIGAVWDADDAGTAVREFVADEK